MNSLGEYSFSEKDLRFRLPFGMILSGPSSSGKSTFLIKFLSEADSLVEPAPKAILYCYGEYNEGIGLLQRSGVNVCFGVPSEEQLKQQSKPFILVLDDLMLSKRKNFSPNFSPKSLIINIFRLYWCFRICLIKRLKSPG